MTRRSRRDATTTATDNEEEVGLGTPLRYAPLCEVYSATSPCSEGGTPPLVHVYSRRRPSRTDHSSSKPSFFDSLVSRFGDTSEDSPELVAVKEEPVEEVDMDGNVVESLENGEAEGKKRQESLRKDWLGPIKGKEACLDTNMMELQFSNGNTSTKAKNVGRKRKRRAYENGAKANGNGPVDPTLKKWVRLSFDGVEPEKFIGLKSKVYWPLDDDWYDGQIVGYNSETGRHQVSYEDGDKENVIISIEKIKFHVSPDEMQRLNLKYCTTAISDGLNFNELVVLAASFDDDHDLGTGDIIWAKLAGHAVWPAVIVDESILVSRKGLHRTSDGKSIPVQFFGTHDFARVNLKQVISFLKGLLSSFHLKCRKPNFLQSLEEAKIYLSEQHLPERMLRMQNGEEADDCDLSSQEDEKYVNSGVGCMGAKEVSRKVNGMRTCPFEVGDLRVISLGNIVKDSKFFHDEKSIWPAGYTAVRKFSSITDPSAHAFYKMEVLRDVDSRLRPLFKVTVDGLQFKGSTPTACWNKIYKRIWKMQENSDPNEGGHFNKRIPSCGSEMFGFSNPEVMKLIKELSNSRRSLKSSSCKWISQISQDSPVGYRAVDVKWKDLDKCSVCHMDEEYENNLFLQCDKCRMMVHAKCYGELEPVDGVLWLCNLCRPGAPRYSPPCCLCPVRGGAMKPTTDGRWAHLACAIWIPETCLSDIKKMEPIDGISRVSKDRWKLLCSICGVSYGACIQCSNSTCRVAYHPLCARVAGYCIELADEDKLHLINMDDDEELQCIQLLSFCMKHRPRSRERLKAENRILPVAQQVSENVLPLNPSGCARSEPFNFLGRRGRKEPEALAASSLKRLFVEDKPYLVHGFCRHGTPVDMLSSASSSFWKPTTPLVDVSNNIHSMMEKFSYMRNTCRKRLAFGKSGIHGFGIFAKLPHRAGDMVIEYTGELVRPAIADRREHLIYNSLVGAGTYMFRIDNERVIDATRAGSIAHLINHSCEPNCYSRVITVNGDEHIIIFAKRDIKQWEELTYDYRFMSIDEQLPCYCGHVRCRGVVNDIEAEELVGKLRVPCSELKELSEE